MIAVSWSGHLYQLLKIFSDYKTRYDFVVLNKLSILTLNCQIKHFCKYKYEQWSISASTKPIPLSLIDIHPVEPNKKAVIFWIQASQVLNLKLSDSVS